MNDPDSGLTLREVVKLPAYWILAFMFILTNLGPTFSVSFYKVKSTIDKFPFILNSRALVN